MQKGTDLILVTGATGNQGNAVARQLLANGHKVRAMTRRPEGAAAQALGSLGAEVVQGDFDDSASLERALQGAWGVFAVQNTWEAGVEKEEEQGKRLAELARKMGVTHFVYTSVGSADRATGIPHFDNKWRIEEAVRRLGFPSHTILRPVFFMENWTSPWFKPGLDQGKLMIGLKPETVLQMISVADIGKYGVIAFEQYDMLDGEAIDIAGDEKTMPETAGILGKAMGKSVTFVQVPIEEARKSSEDFAIMLEWFDRVGYDVGIASLEKRFGIRPTSLAEWAGKVSWA
jgi:uncharacterized protein YbjT (DUF2867 family)